MSVSASSKAYIISARKSDKAVWLALCAILLATAFISLGLGRVWVPPERIGEVLWNAVMDPTFAQDLPDTTVVITLRLPRILLAMLCGAVLAMCGAALQGTLRNPLVGPQTMAVLPGAAFGGCLSLFFSRGPLMVIASGFFFGVLSMVAVLWIARTAGGTSVLMVVLAGTVVSALFAAMTTLLQFVADPEQQLPTLVFWLMGSLANSSGEKVMWAFLPMLASGLILYLMAFRINVLSSGDEEAASLGLAVSRSRAIVLLAVAVGCAAVVAVAGVIAWIGLVAPHIARMLVGADHRRLLPAAALVGSMLLVVADTFCRSATAAEFPLGAATAVLGAPVFVALLRKNFGNYGSVS